MNGNLNSIDSLKNFQSEARNNLNKIKLEINKSVDVLTRAFDKNVTESLKYVTRDVKKLEEQSASVADSLLHVTKDVDELTSQSSKVFIELSKLKTGTQRSVDASSGLRLNLSRMEGEFLTSTKIKLQLLYIVKLNFVQQKKTLILVSIP